MCRDELHLKGKLVKSRDGVVTAVAKWWPWPPSTSISSFLTDLSPSRLAAHNRLSYQLDSIHYPMLPFQSPQRNCLRPILIESEPTSPTEVDYTNQPTCFEKAIHCLPPYLGRHAVGTTHYSTRI